MEMSRHIVLYSKNKYEDRRESDFLNDMKQLAQATYGWPKESSEVGLDMVYLMMKSCLEKYNIGNKVTDIVEAVMFHGAGLHYSDVMNHTYKTRPYFQEDECEEIYTIGTYASKEMKEPLEIVIWLMLRALHNAMIKRDVKNGDGYEWIVEDLGEPDFEFAERNPNEFLNGLLKVRV